MDETKIKYEIINELCKVTNSLLEIKDKLIDLEKKGLKNDNYYKLLEEYNSILQLEESIYNKIYKSRDILIDFLNYLYQRYDIDEFDIDISYFIELNNDLIYKRIINKLSKYIFDLPMEKIDLSEEDDALLLEIEQLELLEKEKCKMKKYSYINRYISMDIIKLFLMHIDNYINKSKKPKYIDKLIKLKYNLIFVCSDIEEECVYNKFDLGKFYLISKMVSDLLFISEEEYFQIKNDCISMVIYECDNKHKKGNKSFSKLIEKLLLFSVSGLLNKDEISKYSNSLKSNKIKGIELKILSLKPYNKK